MAFRLVEGGVIPKNDLDVDTLGVEATGISKVMLESVDVEPDEWISLIEVSGVSSVWQWLTI